MNLNWLQYQLNCTEKTTNTTTTTKPQTSNETGKFRIWIIQIFLIILFDSVHLQFSVI